MTTPPAPPVPLPVGPSFVVETSLASVVTPKLNHWLDDLSAAIPRLIDRKDSEAVHDLRVSLRRIRSLLRVVRSVFGRFHTTRIRAEMQRTAAATGVLRDEEVLACTLAALNLDSKHCKALSEWVCSRKERETELREEVVELLAGGALDAPQAELRALLTLPVQPGRDKEAYGFARRVVLSAQEQVDALRIADVSNVVGMHDLRIAYKRLRYAVEALAPVLPPELRAWGQVAVGFQKILGSLHDHDVALEVVGRAEEMPLVVRIAVLDALSEARMRHAQQYLAAVGLQVVEANSERG